MQSTIEIITPAQNLSLVSLYEAKIALGFATSTDTALDEQLEMFIEWASAEIAVMCNRTFARETVIETYTSLGSHDRVYLSHYPIKEITLIDEDGTTLVVTDDYNVDLTTGLVRRVDSAWSMPVSFSYTGGYDLPNDAPKALRNAALLLTREAYFAASRGDASIRQISHKESRITYFDPNAKSASSGGGEGGSAAQRSVGNILKKFTRFYV